MVNVLHTDVHEASDLIGWRLLLSVALIAGLPAWWLWRTPLQAAARRVAGPAQRRGAGAGAEPGRRPAGAERRADVLDHAQPQVAALHGQPGELVLRAGPAGVPEGRAACGPAAGHRRRRAAAAAPRRRTAAAADAGGGRNGARRPLRAQRLRAQHQPRDRGAGPDQLCRRQLLRHQHRGLAAVHVLAPRPRGLRRAQAGAARTCSTCCSAPAWRCCGWTTSPAARACATACRNAAAIDAPPGSAHAPGLCRDGECLDEALLTGLDQRLAALPEERRQRGVVLVLHQMGSHGPAYYKRSPADGQALPARVPDPCAAGLRQACAGQCLRQLHRLHRPRAGQVHRLAVAADRRLRPDAAVRVRPRRVAGREQHVPARPALRAGAARADPCADADVAAAADRSRHRRHAAPACRSGAICR